MSEWGIQERPTVERWLYLRVCRCEEHTYIYALPFFQTCVSTMARNTGQDRDGEMAASTSAFVWTA